MEEYFSRHRGLIQFYLDFELQENYLVTIYLLTGNISCTCHQSVIMGTKLKSIAIICSQHTTEMEFNDNRDLMLKSELTTPNTMIMIFPLQNILNVVDGRYKSRVTPFLNSIIFLMQYFTDILSSCDVYWMGRTSSLLLQFVQGRTLWGFIINVIYYICVVYYTR